MENKKIVIERVFDAPREKVWHAWTTPEVVKQWWGPEGFSAPSIQIDFKVGGKYVYAMHGPEGSEWDKDMYNAGVFKEIVPMERLVVTDYFSDENGNKIDPVAYGQSEDMPDEMHVTVLFEDVEGGKTKLSLIYSADSEAMYEALIKSGMQEGWSTSLDKLAETLKSI